MLQRLSLRAIRNNNNALSTTNKATSLLLNGANPLKSSNEHGLSWRVKGPLPNSSFLCFSGFNPISSRNLHLNRFQFKQSPQRSLSYTQKRAFSFFKNESVEDESDSLEKMDVQPNTIGEAVLLGDLEKMKEFMKNGVDIKAVTPLYLACRYGHIHIVEEILKMGAGINDKLPDSETTPLAIAIDYSHLELVKFLLQHKADPNISTDDLGHTPIFLSTATNNLEITQELVKHGAKINISDSLGINLLQIAASCNLIQMVQYFLTLGIDINAQEILGNTALHLVCEMNNLGMANLLLEHRANPDIQNISNRSPLHIAVDKDEIEMVQLLLQYNARLDLKTTRNEKVERDGIGELTPFHFAVSPLNKYGNFDIKLQIVTEMIKSGVNINCKAQLGFTPLHLACRDGTDEIVELLLQHGADINALTDSNELALDYAVSTNKIKSVEALLRLSPDQIEIQTGVNGGSLLHIAASYGFEEMVYVLLANGAQIDFQSNLGFTALHWACWYNWENVFDALSLSGANLNLRNNEGDLPIHLVAFNGNLTLTQKILNLSPYHLNDQGRNGETALHVSISNSHLIVTRLLLKYGADIHIKDDSGKTAFEYFPSKDFENDVREYLRGLSKK